MKKGMCLGCENKVIVAQYVFWDINGKKIDVPKIVHKEFCIAYQLHIEYVSMLVEDVCYKYR